MIADKLSVEILTYLLREHCDANYKIIAKQDIVNALPAKRKADLGTVDIVLRSLEAKQYVTTKFNDAEEVCINLTLKGFAEVQEGPDYAEEKLTASVKNRFYVYIGVICFVAGFAGTLSALFLAKLLGL